MADKQSDDPAENPGDVIAQIRDEMSAQFATMKEAFESQLAELRASNEQLKRDNDGLKAALVRSALTDPPREEPKERTEAEIYQDNLQHAIKRSKELTLEHYKE